MATVRRKDSTDDHLPELEITLDSYNNPITVVSGTGKYKTEYINILHESNHLCTDIGSADISNFILQKVCVVY